MRQEQLEQFNLALQGMAAGHLKHLDPHQAEAYWRVLEDLDLADVMAGIRAQEHGTSGRMPTPGQLRATCLSQRANYAQIPEWHPDEPPEIARQRASADFSRLTNAQVAANYLEEAKRAAQRESAARASMQRFELGSNEYRDSLYEATKSNAEQKAFREHARWWAAADRQLGGE